MKTRFLTMLVLFALLAFAVPQTGNAGHGYGHSGWYWTGGFLGGLFLGSALSGAYYPPRPVYVYPTPPVIYGPSPIYVYPAPRYGYTQRDPGFSGPPETSQQDSGAPTGEWITVPGQWVKGRWVPEHRAWVPFNP